MVSTNPLKMECKATQFEGHSFRDIQVSMCMCIMYIHKLHIYTHTDKHVIYFYIYICICLCICLFWCICMYKICEVRGSFIEISQCRSCLTLDSTVELWRLKERLELLIQVKVSSEIKWEHVCFPVWPCFTFLYNDRLYHWTLLCKKMHPSGPLMSRNCSETWWFQNFTDRLQRFDVWISWLISRFT